MTQSAVFDTVEVSGSNPLVPTISFNKIDSSGLFCVAPKHSNKGLSCCKYRCGSHASGFPIPTLRICCLLNVGLRTVAVNSKTWGFKLVLQNHFGDSPLSFPFGPDYGLRIDLESTTAASMSHKFLDDLHIFPIGDKER
jgi:hypothetical protein